MGSEFEYLLNKSIETMSFVRKKQVSLFLSMLSQASYLIYDEATEGIDVKNKDILLSFSHILKNQGRSLIYTTHDLLFAQEVSDEVFIIKNGILQKHIVVDDSTDLFSLYKSSEG